MDLFNLEGRIALVTGAARGLGRVMAEGLAEAGATVVVNDIAVDPLGAAVAELRAAGFTAHGFAFDVTDPAAIDSAVARIEGEVGPIDILVNNAGLQIRKPVADWTVDEWRRVIDADLTSAWLMSRAVGLRMVGRGHGKIINIASVNAELARPTIVPYSAAKGGVKMLTRGLCAEWARHGIQVNAIGPGYFATELTQPLVDDPAFSAWIAGRTPAGRWGRPDELVGACVFLASAASSYVNGQILYVDGGLVVAI